MKRYAIHSMTVSQVTVYAFFSLTSDRQFGGAVHSRMSDVLGCHYTHNLFNQHSAEGDPKQE